MNVFAYQYSNFSINFDSRKTSFFKKIDYSASRYIRAYSEEYQNARPEISKRKILRLQVQIYHEIINYKKYKA